MAATWILWNSTAALAGGSAASFPLIPGAGIYYTTNYLARGDMAMFTKQGGHTIAIAGVIAVGILLVSTTVRLFRVWKQNKSA